MPPIAMYLAIEISVGEQVSVCEQAELDLDSLLAEENALEINAIEYYPPGFGGSTLQNI